MATLGEAADNYQPSTKTMNIADLEKVSLDIETVEDTFEFERNGEKKTVVQDVIIIDEVKYKVPKTVLQQLQIIKADNPALKFCKVKKSGTTKDDTRYVVIPLLA